MFMSPILKLSSLAQSSFKSIFHDITFMVFSSSLCVIHQQVPFLPVLFAHSFHYRALAHSLAQNPDEILVVTSGESIMFTIRCYPASLQLAGHCFTSLFLLLLFRSFLLCGSSTWLCRSTFLRTFTNTFHYFIEN